MHKESGHSYPTQNTFLTSTHILTYTLLPPTPPLSPSTWRCSSTRRRGSVCCLPTSKGAQSKVVDCCQWHKWQECHHDKPEPKRKGRLICMYVCMYVHMLSCCILYLLPVVVTMAVYLSNWVQLHTYIRTYILYRYILYVRMYVHMNVYVCTGSILEYTHTHTYMPTYCTYSASRHNTHH